MSGEAATPSEPRRSDDSPPRVAVFGGSFNPPHVGHVLACTYLLSTQGLDRVLVIPVYQHPFDKELAPFDVRFAMCERAMGWLPGVEISDLERQLGGESRTLYTIESLRARHPGWTWRLVIGSDVLPDLDKWHRFDRIAELAPPIVLGRVGHEDARAPAAVLPAVSSTEIRRHVQAGTFPVVAPLVPLAVASLIEERRLYRSS